MWYSNPHDSKNKYCKWVDVGLSFSVLYPSAYLLHWHTPNAIVSLAFTGINRFVLNGSKSGVTLSCSSNNQRDLKTLNEAIESHCFCRKIHWIVWFLVIDTLIVCFNFLFLLGVLNNNYTCWNTTYSFKLSEKKFISSNERR